jgi:general stress protein YciG
VDGVRKERRGFASMSPEKQREIASKGGRAAHEKGTAHEWTPDEARAAGRKGGQISRGGRGRLAPTSGNDVNNVGTVPGSGMEPGRTD